MLAQKFSVGISSGITTFTQKAEEEDRYYGDPFYKTRFTVRGNFMFHIKENFGLRIEIAYQQQGYDRKHKSYYGQAINQHKFDYLSFPLLAEISFGKRTKVKAHVGASIDYLLNHIWVWQIDQDDIRPIDKTDEYERVNYSALAGLGVGFPLTERLSLEIESRCSIGLKTLRKENSWVKFKHFGFVNTLGLRYSLGS